MDTTRWHRCHAWLLILLVAGVMTARQPDKVVHPQFWAEDAARFFVDAEMFGASAIAQPYAGYWNLTPRLVASSVRVLPVLYLPAVYSAAAAMVTALTVLYLVYGSFARTRMGAVAMAAALLVAPFSGEIWYVLTNVQWVTAVVPVVALGAARPRGRLGRAAVLSALLLVGLTGPFTLLFAPLAAVRLWFRREGWSWLLAAAMAFCGLLTLIPLLQHSRTDVEPVWQRGMALLHHLQDRLALSIACASAVALFAHAATRGARKADLPLLVTGLAGSLILAAFVVSLPRQYLAALPANGGRYLLLPWTFAVWALILLLERGHRWTSVPLTVAVVVALHGFRLPPRTIYDWARDAQCLETSHACSLTVNPGWTFVLPGRQTPIRPDR